MRSIRLSKSLRLLTFFVIFTFLFTSIFQNVVLAVDSWTPQQQKESDFIYYWNGTSQQPADNAGDNVSLNSIKVTGITNQIKKYQLANLKGNELLWTYCSDFAIQPVVYNPSSPDANRLYKRIPLENIKADDGFFSDSKLTLAEQAQQLRAILLNSDLWLDLATMRERSGIANLTMGEAQAATQIAIWTRVNGIVPSFSGAMTNNNVLRYKNYLLGLPGVAADSMASIKMVTTTKEMISGDKWQVVLEYEIIGLGLDENTLQAEVSATATATLDGGSPSTIEAIHDKENKTFTFTNIPQSADLDVDLSASQDGVRSVYLFAPSERKHSQTLISVVLDTVPLLTKVTIEYPKNLTNLTIYKDWRKSSNNSLLPNAVVENETTTYRFTYHGGGFDGLEVIGNKTITGNGSATTADVFEAGKSYKVEEIEVNGEAPVTTQVKYFTVKKTGDDLSIVWTTEDGKALDEQATASRFNNYKEIQTGAVKVAKVVTNDLGLDSDSFSFKIEWKSPESVSSRLYKNESFLLYTDNANPVTATTDENGLFELKNNQQAVFSNIPVGSVITVTEQNDAALAARYTMDVVAKTANIDTTDTKEITVTNSYKTGSLTITKDILTGDLSWDDFATEATALVFTVVDADQVSHTVKLYKGHTSETLTNLPIGSCVITEDSSSAKKTGYAWTVTPENGTMTVTIPQGSTVTADFTNSYREQLGNLVVEKTVAVNASGLTETQITEINAKTFTFYLKQGTTALANIPYTIMSGVQQVSSGSTGTDGSFTLSHGQRAEFNNLKPGNYVVEEQKAAALYTNVNHTITINGNDVTSSSTWSRTATVQDQQTATASFINNYSRQSGSLTVEKKVAGDLTTANVGRSFKFLVTGPDNYEETFELSTEKGWSKTITGLTPGEYTVAEIDGAEVANYTVATTYAKAGKVTVVNNQTVKETVTNTYTRLKGAVQFTKVVVRTDSEDASFLITVDGTPYNGKVLVNGNAVPEIKNGALTGIKNGDIVKIENLPAGAVVTITENANANYSLKITDAKGEAQTGSNVDITVPTTNTVTNSYTFTNTRKLVDLTIDKTLTGELDWSKFTGFTFTITGPKNWDASLDLTAADGPYADYNFTLVSEGKYTFVLTKDHPSLTIAGLPAGSYKVVETRPTVDGYNGTTSHTVNNGSAVSGETANITINEGSGKISFTNNYTLRVGTLVTEKVLVNGDSNHEFTFDVTFEKAIPETVAVTVTGTPLVADSVSWNADRTVLTYTIKGSGSVTIAGIPDGSKYTVTERAHDQYDTTYSANQTGITSTGSITVKVTNTRIAKAVVTVKKVVSGHYENESFKFTIKVNGTAWKSKAYTLIEANGVTTSSKTTDSSGVFTLLDGQTAKFENIPLGATVEITESTASNYTLSEISGGTVALSSRKTTVTATTVVGENDANVVFTNAKNNGNLSVTKTISGDASFDYGAHAFTFKLSKGSVAQANTTYELYNSDGKKVDASYATDDSGLFDLMPGQVALFKDLSVGSYTVTEVTSTWQQQIPAGIKFTAPAAQTKSVENGKTAAFSLDNKFEIRTGELAVKKVLTTNTPAWETLNESFEFTLYQYVSDEESTAIANKPYTVTDKNGKAKAGTFATTAEGKFTLLAGETAKFTGLANGDYYVVETTPVVTDYIVATPNGDGLANAKAVSDTNTTTPLITVSNALTREAGKLSVTKTVEKPVGDTLTVLDEHKFTFTLFTGEAGSGTPVKNFAYSVGQNTYRTDANGMFTLTNGQTALFNDLPTGNYYVVESDYTVTGYDRNMDETLYPLSASGTVAKATLSELAFTNAYTRVSGSLIVTKHMASAEAGNKQVLDTWSYTFLIEGPADWDGSNLEKDANGNFYFTLDNETPELTLTDLPSGDYTVTEVADESDPAYVQVIKVGVNGAAATAADEATVAVGGTTAATLDFTNSYRIKGAVITLQKNFSGIATADVTKEFTFTLERQVSPGEWEPALVDEVTLSSALGWTKEIELPEGHYRIKEVETPNITKYSYLGISYQVTKNGQTNDQATVGDDYLLVDVADNVNITVNATNRYTKDGAMLQVTKEVSGYIGVNDEFVFQLSSASNDLQFPKTYTVGEATKSTDSLGIFTLKAGETAVFTDLTTNTEYSVTELEPSSPGYYELESMTAEEFSYYTVDKTRYVTPKEEADARTAANMITAEMDERSGQYYPALQFTFTNKRLVGNLMVTKTLTGPAFEEGPFRIYVNFTEGTAVADPAKFINDLVITGADAFVDEENDRLVLDINANSSATIQNIPAGLNYSISEATGNQHYDVSYDENRSGKITPDTLSESTVNNVRKFGEISITKSVIGNLETSANERFTVELSFTPGGKAWTAEELASNFTVSGGSSTSKSLSSNKAIVRFSIGHGETVTIADIPTGTSYEIKELLTASQSERYSPMILGADGMVDPYIATVSKGEANKDSVSIFNFDVPYNSLVFGKEVVASPGSAAEAQRFDFLLTINQPEAESGYIQERVMVQLENASSLYTTLAEQILLLEDELASKQIALAGVEEAALETLRKTVTEEGKLTEAARNELEDLFITCSECNGIYETIEQLPCPAECNEGEIGSPVDCVTCGKTGSVSEECTAIDSETKLHPEECTACKNGFITSTCTTCNGDGQVDGEAKECTTCGGDGLVDGKAEKCTTCKEGKVENTAAINAAIATAEDIYEQVIAEAKAELEDLTLQLEELKAKETRLMDIIDKLSAGVYVEFDPDTYEITLEEPAGEGALAIEDSQFRPFRRTASGGIQEITLSQVGFTRNEDGSFSFRLATNEFVMVNDLPVGSTYEILEDYAGGRGFIKTTVIANGSERDTDHFFGSIPLEETITTDNVIQFVNYFEEEFGSLSVYKAWRVPSGTYTPTSVTVELLMDGLRTGQTVTLRQSNGWSGTFDNLELGHSYSVRETPVPAGYTVSYSGNNGVLLEYENKDSETITVTNRRRTTTEENPPEEEDIPEEDVPLGPPEEEIEIIEEEVPLDSPPEEEIDIFDPEIPLSDIPRTGDADIILCYVVALLLSGAGMVLTMVPHKKRKNNQSS